MKWIDFKDIHGRKVEGCDQNHICYYSYKEGDLEICIEPLIPKNVIVAAYIKENLIFPKITVDYDPTEFVRLLLSGNTKGAIMYNKNHRFEVIGHINELYEKYKLKKGEVCPRNKSKILE